MARITETVLQRFEQPKAVKGTRAVFILTELRWLIAQHTLPAHRQFVALQTLMYLEGFSDRLPNVYTKQTPADAFNTQEPEPVEAEPDSEITDGLTSLVQSLQK
jgi:hypothetical protein